MSISTVDPSRRELPRQMVTIKSVNIPEKMCSGLDRYGTIHNIHMDRQGPIISIPQQGERWWVVQKMGRWTLEMPLVESILEDKQEGDVVVQGKRIFFSGNEPKKDIVEQATDEAKVVVGEAVDEAVGEITEKIDVVDSRVELVEGTLVEVDSTLRDTRGRLDAAEGTLIYVNQTLVEVDGRMDDVDQTISGVNDQINGLGSLVDGMGADVATAITDASTAQQEANQAVATAAAAQATADAANNKATTADQRITIASADPTLGDGENKPVNAIWEVRVGGRSERRFVWDGNDWNPAPIGQSFIGEDAIGQAQIADAAIGTAQIADGTITNAKIGDATIENGKIKNISATKIDTGTLDSDRIGARSITASKLFLTSQENIWPDRHLQNLVSDDIPNAQLTVTDSFATPAGGKSLFYTGTGTSTTLPQFNAEAKLNDQFVVEYSMMRPSGVVGSIKISAASGSGASVPIEQVSEVGLAVFPNGWQRIRQIVKCVDANTTNVFFTFNKENTGSALFTDILWRKQHNAELIVDGAITTAKLNALAVTAEKIDAKAVTAEKIDALAVTADKIAANAVTTDKLDALAVTAEKIAAESVTADKIHANAVTAEKIDALSVTADKLAGNAINGKTIVGARVVSVSGTDYDLTPGQISSTPRIEISNSTINSYKNISAPGETPTIQKVFSIGGADSDMMMLYGSNGQAIAGFDQDGSLRAGQASLGDIRADGDISYTNYSGEEQSVTAFIDYEQVKNEAYFESISAGIDAGPLGAEVGIAVCRLYIPPFSGGNQTVLVEASAMFNHPVGSVIIMRIRYMGGSSTEIPDPTISSALGPWTRIYRAPSTGVSMGYTRGILKYNVSAGYYAKYLLSYAADTYYGAPAGPYAALSGAGFRPTITARVIGQNQLVNHGWNSRGGGVPYTPAPPDTNPPPQTRSYTKEYNIQAWRSFKGSTIDNTNMQHGYYSPWQRYTDIYTPSAFQNDLNGADSIEKIEIYLKNEHTYYGSGMTAYIGVHSTASAINSAAARGTGKITTSFTSGQGKWVTIPSSWYAQFRSGLWKGFTLGTGAGTSLQNYGQFTGSPTKFRATYTR